MECEREEEIDVPCPQIVHEYNKHMGVDLCDMLMALYCIKLCTRKWYMYIVYYCIGVAIVNGWLLYWQHCEQKKIAGGKVLYLLKFQTQIAHSLLYAGKVGCQAPQNKWGHPSLSPQSSDVSNPHKHQRASVPIPQNDVRFILFVEKQQRCRFCSGGYSRVKCSKCHVQLCLVKDRNCFNAFHHRS